jgi:phage N-6-adenine-methyltransferase
MILMKGTTIMQQLEPIKAIPEDVLQEIMIEVSAIHHIQAMSDYELGKRLLHIQELTPPYINGGFQAIVRELVGYTESYAYKLMKRYQFIEEHGHETRLKGTVINILTSGNTPIAARERIMELAQDGETMSVERARFIVNTYRDMDRGYVQDELEGVSEPPIERPELLERPSGVSVTSHLLSTRHWNEEDYEKSTEWYTPRWIIDGVIDVLGTIDLDPCTNRYGEPRVPATHHYNRADDGLSRDWFGRVFCNPPYGIGITTLWAEKMRSEYEAGRAKEGILLIPSHTDISWFIPRMHKYPICFIIGRVAFETPFNQKELTRNPYGSALVYFGHNPGRFQEVFERLEQEAYVFVQRKE